MRRVVQVMGTAVSIDIPECRDEAVFRRVFNRLRQIDERFSTYVSGSEVSKYARGEAAEQSLSKELRHVIMECRKFEEYTQGYFSAWADGGFEPSGYVKGWAIEQAGRLVEASGYKTYCVGAGGDILARSNSDKIWNIGILDPSDKTKVINTLSIHNGAVCTSGSYERGAHIINSITKKPAGKLLSVTVTGPEIVVADVLATAIFASEEKKPDFLKKFPDYKVVLAI